MRVIVIGAGVIGAAVACELASRGAEVVIVDMRQPGAGATQASAGVLAPFIEGHSPALLRLGAASLSMYDAFVERLRDDAAGAETPFEYRRTGTLEVALDDAQAQRLEEMSARYRATAVEHQCLDSAVARVLEPGLPASTRSALLVPSQGHVAARDLTAALIAAARRRGATVASGVTVVRVAPTGEGRRDAPAGRQGGLDERDGPGGAEGLDVFTTTGTVTGDAVVLAAGAWSGQVAIEPAPRAPVTPIRGQLLQLACAEAPASRVLWGEQCYLVPWLDGTVLAGATVEDVGFDERATVAAVRHLLESACALLPSLCTAQLGTVRVGLRPATRDELPIVGRASGLPNVVYATGHYRNGVLLAPLTAALVAGLVFDGREAPELALTRPDRFGL